jgi:polar amino acid transport system substrate-binding protein
MRITIAAALLAVALNAGCRFPDDVEGTLDRVEGGTLRVGVIDNPPWVVLEGGDPRGVEPTLLRRFAAGLDAEIAWFEGTEPDLMEALHGFQLDVVVGGITRSSPYAKEVSITAPYVDTEIQIGVPPGSDIPDDLGGVEIWVQRYSEPAALLKQEEEDALPRFFDRLDEVDGPALLDTYEIDAIDYERTDYILRDDEHAFAVPAGENAFLIELEQFLLDRGEEAEDLLSIEAERSLRERDS